MNVLLIDGPMRGQIFPNHEASSHAIRFVDYAGVNFLGGEPAPIGTYWVHRYMVAGRVLLLGTVEYSPSGELAEDVFWEFLANDLAKQAVVSVLPKAVPGAAP